MRRQQCLHQLTTNLKIHANYKILVEQMNKKLINKSFKENSCTSCLAYRAFLLQLNKHTVLSVYQQASVIVIEVTSLVNLPNWPLTLCNGRVKVTIKDSNIDRQIHIVHHTAKKASKYLRFLVTGHNLSNADEVSLWRKYVELDRDLPSNYLTMGEGETYFESLVLADYVTSYKIMKSFVEDNFDTPDLLSD